MSLRAVVVQQLPNCCTHVSSVRCTVDIENEVLSLSIVRLSFGCELGISLVDGFSEIVRRTGLLDYVGTNNPIEKDVGTLTSPELTGNLRWLNRGHYGVV